MDGDMYAHPATRSNVERLRSYGYTIVEPEVGPLASGQVGPGRLAETARIVRAVVEAVAGKPIRQPELSLRPALSTPLRPRDLDGWHVVITAGGTAEPIDPVRYIGNRSTGKMGVAIAEAALARGARVTLIAGMTSVPLPDAATIVHTPTAGEMRDAVLAALPAADALIMAAAVADFRPKQPADSKIGRQSGLTLELVPTADILAEASAQARTFNQRPLIVGFAAETGSLERAQDKAERKGVDLLVGNDVAEEGSGFGTPTNRVTIFAPGTAAEPWPLLTKREVADRLLDRLVSLRAATGASLAAT
jgi:phosphopantothenoylcysteine decarboxylase/phosphopantothenate--cysteine ligase